jgi:WD40 repeat protein
MSDFPYPGLRPFERHETDIFFGREDHTDQLIDKLGQTHFIAVVGPSGCGKSSLVRTGLLADLERGFLASAGVHWRIAELRPGNHPFARLTTALLSDQALRPEYLTHFTDDTEAPAFLRASLCRGPLGLHEILRDTHLPDRTNLLVLVDQFEELFRYFRQGEANEAAAFVELLLMSSQHPIVYVVLTMRSDFLGDGALFYGLPEAINQGLFLTPRLSREQLREAIEGPAQVFNGHIEPKLVNRLLNDMGSDPDQLPLMQHALMRMWHLARLENPEQVTVTSQNYEVIGTLTKALSQHAEEAYTELNPEQQRIAEILFRSLTDRSGGRGDTRRPVKLAEVATLVNVPCQQITQIVEVFRQPARSFLTPPADWQLEPDSILDISHESLIRKWQRLKEWTKKEARLASLYRRLEDTASRWDKGQASLWHGPELEEALAWRLEANPTPHWAKRYGQQFDLAIKFLDASVIQQQAEQRRKLRRQRAHKIIFGLIAISIVAFLEYRQRQSSQAAQQAKLAQFESQLTNAILSARGDDYAEAQQFLKNSLQFDPEISVSRRHARNILTWFTRLKGSVPQQTYEVGIPLFAVAVSPDGHLVAGAGEKGTLKLLEVSSNNLKSLPGHEKKGPVRAVVFDPNGHWLASAGDDKRIIFWKIPNGDKWKEWKAPAKVKALAISPDGKYLASGGEDANITLWEITTGNKSPLSFEKHKESISEGGLAFHPTKTWLASASYDNTVRLWETTTGKLLDTLRHTDDVANVTFSPDGEQLATSSDKNVWLWNLKSGELPLPSLLQGHKNRVFGSHFITKDGRHYLVSASQDRTLRLWDTDSGTTLRVLQGHTAGVTNLDYDATTGQLFSASLDGKIMRWDLTLSNQQIIDLKYKTPISTAIAPAGNQVAVGFADGTLRLYSLPDSRLQSEIQAHSKEILHLAFHPNGTLLASASFDKTVKLWRVTADELATPQTFSHPDKVRAVAFSPNGHLLVTGSNNGQIGLFPLGTEQSSPRTTFYQAHQGQINSVEIDASGTYLLSGGADGYTRFWNLQEDPPTKPVQEYFKAKDEIIWATRSPDQQRFATLGRKNFSAYIYATANGQELYPLEGHEQTIYRAIFSPDSQQLLTVSGDATVRWWDLNTASELLTLDLPTQAGPTSPLWDFDFRCTAQECWIAVPLTRGKLVLYHLDKLGQIYD